MTIKVIPTAEIKCAREGGSTKFGGSPLGLSAIGILDGSILGGKECIAAVCTRERGRLRKCQAREVRFTEISNTRVVCLQLKIYLW